MSYIELKIKISWGDMAIELEGDASAVMAIVATRIQRKGAEP